MSLLTALRKGLALLMWLLIAAGILALAWIWLLSDFPGQERMMATVPIGMLVGLLGIVALCAVKGRARRPARVAAVVMVLAVAAIPAVFRLKGLTGDFHPVFEYRFAPKHDTTLAPLPAAAPVDAAAPELGPPASGDRPAIAVGPAGGGHDAGPTPDAAAGATPPEPAGAPETTEAGPIADEAAPPARAVSFPQFLGPTRSGVVPGVRLARDWSARPPRLVWRKPVGAGWSGFAIDRGVAITQEQRGPQEMVVAYDLLTGTPLWSHGDAVRYDSVIAGDGPRATPTISGRYVAALGSTGLLNVLDFRTGRRVWSKDIAADNDAPDPEWGRSGSPLVLDGKVIVSAGGPGGRSLVAYDLRTGARVWSGGDDGVGYASPTVLTLLGRPQIVISNRETLAGHDPETGAVLWSQKWVREPTVAMPIRIADDLVLGSTGYGIGSKLVRLTAGPDGTIAPSLAWESPRLKAKFTNPVLHDGFVYGLDDGVLVCLDVSTGERRWRAGRYGHGQTLLVDGLLLVTTEDGDIVLVEATPAAHRELSRITAFDAKTWNPPAVAGPYLLVRTDKQAALYELAVE
jgi:outer membrane protein assembly factor BamB